MPRFDPLCWPRTARFLAALWAGVAINRLTAAETPNTWDTSGYAVTRWEMKDGLPLNKVRAVAQTTDGYLWVGTFNGLARFDGVRFTVFDVANTPGLRHNGIESLGVDAAGGLWVGDTAGGITVLQDGRFSPLDLPAAWPAKPVLRLVAARNGPVWAMNDEGMLLALRPGAAPKLIRLRASPSLFAVDDAGGAWVAQAGQLHRLDEAGGRAEPAGLRLEGPWQAVFPGRRGGLWILNDDRMRRWQNGEWVEDRGRSPWGTIVLAAFHETRAGQIVAGSFKEGLRILNADGSGERCDEGNGLAHNWVYCVLEDREGTVWVGTGNGGLHGLHPRRVTMIDAPDHWRSSAVLSVTPARGGGLWIGTEGGGVYRMQDGVISNPPVRAGIWQAVANSVLEDRRGRLWVGTWSSGLRYLEQDEFKPAYHATDGRNVVLTVFESRTGDIWVGTRHGPGRLRDGQWEWFDQEPLLQGAVVRCLAEQPDGTMWCGLDGGGIVQIGSAGTRQFRAADGLASDQVRTIFADPDGTVWIGTRSGLSRYHDGRLASITTRHGLPSDAICQILDSGDGHLWMGSFGGLFRVAKTELNDCADGRSQAVKCLVGDLSSGLATLEMSEQGQPAGCRTSDGRLWFATGKGLALVVPSQVRENPLPPPVRIEDVLVDGDALAISPAQARLQIPPGGRQFEFRYTGLSLINPGRVGFRYRLDGLHQDWFEAGARRSAYYTQLAPGDYRFFVMARNADGVWNEQGASLAFRVLPYFWQTWWFKSATWIGSTLLVGLTVLTVVRRSARRRLDALERQRALERERGRIARDIHDDLGSNLTRIVMLSESARGGLEKPEDTAAHLTEICQTSRDLTLQLSEIVWAVNPEHDTLDSFANYAGNHARTFLERAGIRCRLGVPITLPALPLDSPLRHNLFLAFKEALHNAAKHADAPAVLVTLALADGRLSLTVQDDGRGFDPTVAAGAGNGLGNMARRLSDIGGRCEIDSAPGRGTRVTFVVPVPQPTSQSAHHANL
jgi:signal transduction histidine kinase/ligand-binding sensor domain-containing protein